MLLSLREEAEGKLQMLLPPRKNGPDSLFEEVRVFKVGQTLTRAAHTFAWGDERPRESRHVLNQSGSKMLTL